MAVASSTAHNDDYCIKTTLLKVCNSLSGWTPARWCCSGKSNLYSWTLFCPNLIGSLCTLGDFFKCWPSKLLASFTLVQ